MSNQLLKEILDELKTAKQECQYLNLNSQINNRFDSLEAKMSTIELDIKEVKSSV